MIATRAPEDLLTPLKDAALSLTAVPVPGDIPSASPAKIVCAAQGLGMQAAASSSVAEALQGIIAKEKRARIVILGSLYLAGAVLADLEGATL